MKTITVSEAVDMMRTRWGIDKIGFRFAIEDESPSTKTNDVANQ